MVFSVNQARHFYVTNESIVKDKNFKITPNGELFFHFDDIDGRSDLINLKNIEYVKLIKAESYAEKYLRNEITVHSVKPNTSYVIHVEVCNQAGFGDEESFMFFGAYKTKPTGDTAATVAKGLTDSLNATIRKYSSLPSKVTTAISQEAQLAAYQKIGFKPEVSANKITITPVKPEFILGKSMDRHPLIHVYVSPEGDETTVTWASNAEVPATDTTVKNSQMVANMEYFYKKERADQYDGMLWPNNIEYQGNANPKNATGYDILEIHYSYTGSNEGIQKSEKDLTVAAPTGTKFDAVIAELKKYVQVCDSSVSEVTGTGDAKKEISTLITNTAE